MLLSERDKEFHSAVQKGEEDFDNSHWDDSIYGEDFALKESYRRGWVSAKNKYTFTCAGSRAKDNPMQDILKMGE